MKNWVYAVVVVFMGLLSATALAGSSPDSSESSVESLKQETQALGEALQEYGSDQKEQAEDSINKTLSALDKRIQELEQQLSKNWDDMSDTARERSQKSLESLREQRARVQNWYQELKDSSASAWEKARKGFSDAYEALSEQWNNTEEELDQDSEKRSDSI
jgi:type II secretory pathway pseudopilin PulG